MYGITYEWYHENITTLGLGIHNDFFKKWQFLSINVAFKGFFLKMTKKVELVKKWYNKGGIELKKVAFMQPYLCC
jgi:hypothetical protein